MDQLVLQTQQWLNNTYGENPGYNKILENGKTGWATIYALTRALQIELGISEPADNFGPTTESLFQPLMRGFDNGVPNNQIYILQGALWCKGIPPGAFSGIFDDNTEITVKNFQADAGLTNLDGIVTTQIMKALLDMSAFTLIFPEGDSRIRDMQQSLNRNYNAYFGLQPCDGLYGRNTNKALIYALQSEEGMSTGVANGYFGNGTTSRCPTLSLNDTQHNFVLILQYALYCNGYDPGAFDGEYTSTVQSAVSDFQRFMALPVTGVADMSTIKSLLSSAGDTNRNALACDCATILSANTAQAIKSAGFKYVGRYLTGTANGISKAMTRDELAAVFGAGLNIFPIYEDGGYKLDYFNNEQGIRDAELAITAAQDLGIPSSTTIYFAVDFDALDEDITSNVLPYFEGIHSVFSVHPYYKIGIYGARNICTRVSDAGFSENSFVADMSTGFSGNLGFGMPKNWTFDQFNTITVGNSSLGYVEVDMNAYSGNDEGVDYVHPIDSLPSEDEIYQARYNKLFELKSVIPILSKLSDLTFAFDTFPFVLRTGLLTVTLKGSTELTFPGSDHMRFTVKNGEISTDFNAALDQFSSLSSTQKIQYGQIINGMAASVEFGDISVKILNTATEFSIEIVSNYDMVKVNENYTTKFSTVLTFTVDYIDSNYPTDPEVEPGTEPDPEGFRVPWDSVLEKAINGVAKYGPDIVKGLLLVAAVGAIIYFAPVVILGSLAVTSVVYLIQGFDHDLSQ